MKYIIYCDLYVACNIERIYLLLGEVTDNDGRNTKAE